MTNNEPMTAEQRVRELFDYADGPLEDCDRAAYAELIVSLMEKHTAAAVKAAEAHIVELVRERNSARLEIMRLHEHRSELDCTYAGAFGESDGASHCPAAKPCQRCTLERERDEMLAQLSDLAGLLREAKQQHYESDDSPTFSCSKSQSALNFEVHMIQMVDEGEIDSYTPRDLNKCTCGADEWNSKIEEALSNMEKW